MRVVIKDIESLFKGFLWNERDLQKGKSKESWKDVCQSKYNGGLGLKPLEQWNNALLVKHLWNIFAKNLLNLKDDPRKHMKYKIGEAKTE